MLSKSWTLSVGLMRMDGKNCTFRLQWDTTAPDLKNKQLVSGHVK